MASRVCGGQRKVKLQPCRSGPTLLTHCGGKIRRVPTVKRPTGRRKTPAAAHLGRVAFAEALSAT